MALQALGCCNNQLTSLNLQDHTALQSLGCEQNYLHSLPEEIVIKFGDAWAQSTLQKQKSSPSSVALNAASSSAPLTFQFNQASSSSTQAEEQERTNSSGLRP
jgi:hypothetical protein